MHELLSGALVGCAVGLRHALEPDHVAAVWTLVGDGATARSGLRLGLLWGLGHALPVVVLGGALACADLAVPPRLALALELGVGAMLIALGARALRPPAPRVRGPGARPLAIGVVHGLAGTGAFAALVTATFPTPGARVGYLGVLALGSLCGMALVSVAGARGLGWVGRREVVRGAAGAISITLGAYIVWNLVRPFG